MLSVTLGCYYNLLIGLCHKKNIEYIEQLCSPPPLPPPSPTKTKPISPTAPPFSAFSPYVFAFTFPITSCITTPFSPNFSRIALLPSSPSSPPLLTSSHRMSSCHVSLSSELSTRHVISSCRIVMSYCHTYIYKLNTISFG